MLNLYLLFSSRTIQRNCYCLFFPGDSLPPFTGKLRLFAMRFCPYAERSILCLNAKKLQYDLVFINLDHKPEWIFQFNPKGKLRITRNIQSSYLELIHIH